MKNKAKNNNFYKGLFAEFLAIIILTFKAYRIVKWRYKSKFGEIDIIAERGKELCFLEVKVRATQESAKAAINKTQQKRIIAAAQYFAKHNLWANKKIWRFDAFIFSHKNLPQHIKGAFDNLNY